MLLLILVPFFFVSWELLESRTTDLDTYELRRAPRRQLCDLVMSSQTRHKFLRTETLFTSKEILQACVNAELLKKKRKKSHALVVGGFEPYEEIFQSLKRKIFRRMIFIRKKSCTQ